MRGFVTFNVLIQLFGVAVVFLILCSDLVYDLMHGHTSLVSCDWIIVIGFIACPFMWLGSPADISLIAYGAMSCTAISCVIIVILYIGEGIRGIAVAPSYTESVSVNSFFLSLGTISFAYGGAATFPTFQNYMEGRNVVTIEHTDIVTHFNSLFLSLSLIPHVTSHFKDTQYFTVTR